MKFCERPFMHVYLAPDGDVWPCSWMHYSIGNLYTQSLQEIWHGEEAKKARESILNGSFAFCRKTSCPRCERGDLLDLSEEEAVERGVPTDSPVMITIANDKTCNIACTTCRQCIYRPQEGEREQIDESLKRILPYANEAEFLDMNGNGEFLSNPGFLNFLGDLHPVHENFRLNLETNGVLFDEARLHPLSQEKIYNRLLLDIYENPQGLPPVEYVKKRAGEKGLRRVGVWGENEISQAILRLLKKAGVEIAFQLTWFQDEEGDIPRVSMQKFRPELADTVLLLDFYDQRNIINNLRMLKFQGNILNAEELLAGDAP